MTKQEIFRYLIGKIRAGVYDDDYLEKMVDYQALDSTSENYSLFFAHYALHYKNYELTIEEAWKAYRIRRLSYTAWRLLRDAYGALGNWRAYAFFGALCGKTEGASIDIPSDALDADVLDMLSRGSGLSTYPPLEREMYVVGGQGIEKRVGVRVGEFLPRYPWEEPTEYQSWAGVFLEQEPYAGKAELIEDNRWNVRFLANALPGCAIDIMEAKAVEEIELRPQEGDAYILPVAGLDTGAAVTFRGAWGKGNVTVGKWATNFFRIEDRTQISAQQPFIVGKPIPLGHSPTRKKAIIRIMMDALSWARVKADGGALMPHTMAFFSKGVIFDACYTAAEHTLPSVPNIETGLYTHRHQIIDDTRACAILPDTCTIAEQMQQLGYHTVMVLGSSLGWYMRTERGYDRVIAHPGAAPICVGADRIIEQLDAFSECDQYITVQAMDTHLWAADSHRLPLSAETKATIADRVKACVGDVKSPHLPKSPYYIHGNETAIRRTDRVLKQLYDYIEEHFQEDEYIIELYSDHGVSIYDEVPWITSEHMVNGTMMFRGAGVPALGRVDELVSSVDAYAIFAKLAGYAVPEGIDSRLPAAFGGQAREVVYSLSCLPGHLLRCSVRDREYEYRFESKDFVDDEATVSLRSGKRMLYRRDGQTTRVKDAEKIAYYDGLFRDQFDLLDHHDMKWPRDI